MRSNYGLHPQSGQPRYACTSAEQVSFRRPYFYGAPTRLSCAVKPIAHARSLDPAKTSHCVSRSTALPSFGQTGLQRKDCQKNYRPRGSLLATALSIRLGHCGTPNHHDAVSARASRSLRAKRDGMSTSGVRDLPVLFLPLVLCMLTMFSW